MVVLVDAAGEGGRGEEQERDRADAHGATSGQGRLHHYTSAPAKGKSGTPAKLL
jgi:hypothetical protein